MRRPVIVLAVFAVALVVAFPLLAVDTVIHRGVDTFTTTSNGTTFYDFAQHPIPAGFFCKSSAAFTDRVALKGLPLETGAPRQLHGADTVIERLDDAVFDSTGTAVTRIQFRALSMASIAPIKTACGSFHVYITLAGKQPETTMRIIRTSEDGGHFLAPIAANVRLTFIPVKPNRDKGARKLELTSSVTFPASPIPWSTTGGAATKRVGTVLVDTNGDLTPDTLLFGSTGFWPGWKPGHQKYASKSSTLCEPYSCHDESGEQHCTGPVYACYPYNCP
jgi:hypothetical protein